MAYEKYNSNTTLVKVKLERLLLERLQIQNSNTTLVKVKSYICISSHVFKCNSNTTLVKVKFISNSRASSFKLLFKYNSC